MAQTGKNMQNADSTHWKEMWGKYLDPPPEYRFERKVTFVRSYIYPEYKVEMYLQANGPGRVQRVLKAVPRNISTPVPAVVVPFYYPEAMLGFEPETGEKLSGFSALSMLSDLAGRGAVAISAEAYHLTYLKTDLDRNAFSRWQMAGEALLKDHPSWCGIGKLMADTRLLIDLLEEDPLVDPGKIGIAGHSLGGKMAFYTGCWDPRIKVILTSDFGFLWEQSNWEDVWYWGEKSELLKKAGMAHWQLLEVAAGKPFALLAGHYDNEESLEMILKANSYEVGSRNLLFLDHAAGHRPPEDALKKGYDFLLQHLSGA